DIGVTVVEQKPRRFGFGAELSSTEGLKLSAYWMHRNLLGGAENLRFDAEIAGIGGGSGGIDDDKNGIDYTLGTRFARPGTRAAANTLTAAAQISQLDEPDYFERRALLELGLRRAPSK